MPGQGSKVAPLFIAGGGVLFLWSGLSGKSISVALKDLIKGGNPANAPVTEAIAGTPLSAVSAQNAALSAAGITGGGGCASTYLLSRVHKSPYVWGGGTPNGWDCSGAVNWAENKVCGKAIPGFAPNTLTGHGPATLAWLPWLAAHATKLSRQQVGSDDICLWQTHMGIAIDNMSYVSAADQQLGTCVQAINSGGPALEVPTFWRY